MRLWDAIWPNLAANAIWAVPILGLQWLQHRRARHHSSAAIDRLYDRIATHLPDGIVDDK